MTWAPPPAAQSGAPDSGRPIEVHSHTYLDGREVAETVVQYIPAALQRLGY
jgi:hypothetical protein